MADAEHRGYIGTALAVSATTGVYGISFGALAVAAGLSVAKACALSALVFTGGSQFAAVAVIAAGGTMPTAIGNALLLGGRNIAYGFVTAPILRAMPLGRRIVATQLVIDETTALASAQSTPRAARGAFLLTGIALFTCWNLGTLVGAAAGDHIGDPGTYGLDAMFPAAFVALLAPQLRRPGAPGAAITGACIALALLPFAPVGVPVLASVLGLLVAMRTRPGSDGP
ncbi:MAG: AzlC protein [Thermoleophilia bacterium]|nr:AzlC protein [Thermoleophilia bacterium]